MSHVKKDLGLLEDMLSPKRIQEIAHRMQAPANNKSPAKKPSTSAEEIARSFAEHDWPDQRRRYEDPIEFLVQSLDKAFSVLDAACHAANITPEQRAAGFYTIGTMIKKAALSLEAGMKTGASHQATPDLGFHGHLIEAVHAFHRTAHHSPDLLREVAHHITLPVLIAADDTIHEACVRPSELREKLGSKATGFALSSSSRKPPKVGGRWNQLALWARQRTYLARIPLRPPALGKSTDKWIERNAINNVLERYKSQIMARPDIQKWAKGKPDTAWAMLKKEVQRALFTLSYRGTLPPKAQPAAQPTSKGFTFEYLSKLGLPNTPDRSGSLNANATRGEMPSFAKRIKRTT